MIKITLTDPEMLQHLQDNHERVRLWPTWKGGEGEGVVCPCCDANGYVDPQKWIDDHTSPGHD